MSKKKRILLGVLVIIVVIVIGIGAYAAKMLGYFNSGNSNAYDLETVSELSESPLSDTHIIFLGSSVTEGMASKGTSFVEYLAKRNKFTYTKEAVSGTTLVDNGSKSYVQRMINNIPANLQADLFVCQLSTNDAQKELPMGSISDSKKLDDFDTTTIIGAIEYIIAYATETWDVPVVFYTGTKWDNELYPDMIDVLYELQDKWDIHIIDLYKELPVQNVDEETYSEYMNDEIHPTKKGYLEWWTPQMESDLYNIIEAK